MNKKKDNPQEKTFGQAEIKVKALKENEFEFVASGIKEDRYGEIVDPGGIDWKAFKKNPVMLWGHDHTAPPIAKVKRLWKEGKEIKAKAEWAGTKFAQELKELAEGGFLNAVSIGFLPKEWEGDYPNYKFLNWELLEISVVNVPAYADALMQRAKSMGLDEVVKELKTGEKKEEVCDVDEDTKVKDTEVIFDKEQEGNSVTFSSEELKEFKKGIREESPIPKEVLENFSKFSKALDVLRGSLKAVLVESDGKEEKKVEEKRDAKKLEEENAKKLVKIANKAIEAVLISFKNNK